MLENVANALYIDNGEQFNEVRSQLQDAGYRVHWHIICPRDVGVPMCRRRLYVVAVRIDLRFEFAWPTPQVHRMRLLDVIGPAPTNAHLNAPPLGPRGGRMVHYNWTAHSNQLRKRGARPDETWLCNLNESLQFAHMKKDECPCLTRMSQCWIFSHGRYLTARECGLLQGFDMRRVSVVVSDRQFSAMLGNSMSVGVLKMILGAVLPALAPDAEPNELN